MIPIISCPLPGGGQALIKTQDIGGATTGKNPKECDVYVLGWAADGITVDLSLDDFAEIWVSALFDEGSDDCLLYTSPSPRDGLLSRMPSSA